MKQSLYLLSIFLLTFNQTIAQCFEADASIWQNTWASCQKSENPKAEHGLSHWIQYDFGAVRKLSKTWVWNTNDPAKLDQGFRAVSVDYSLDGKNWTHWGEMTFPKAKGEAVYGGFAGPDLQNIDAQYVLITALSNHGHANCMGIAEIKFNLLPQNDGERPPREEGECYAVEEAFVEDLLPTEAFIVWDYEYDGDEEALYFLFQYRAAGTEEAKFIEAEGTEVFLEYLTPNTTYEYRIIAECEEGEFYSEIFTFTTPELEADCEWVTNVRLEELADDKALIAWDALEEDQFYIVRYNFTAQFIEENIDWLETLFDEEPQEELETEEARLCILNLLPNAEYEVRIGVECEGFLLWTEPLIVNTEAENTISSTSTIEEPKDQLFLFPNPTKSAVELIFHSEVCDRVAYRVLDMQGRTLLQKEQSTAKGANRVRLDLARFSEGVYIVEVVNLASQKRTVGRVVKVK
ncbi:MAG: discoidin domain-containing protein [Bacteroidota bacterium]